MRDCFAARKLPLDSETGLPVCSGLHACISKRLDDGAAGAVLCERESLDTPESVRGLGTFSCFEFTRS